jgi:hypothetical protein
MAISYEARARSSVPVRGRLLFHWRRTRLKAAAVVNTLGTGILPLPIEFFVERCPAHELLSARKRWNAAATEHIKQTHSVAGKSTVASAA